MLVSQRFANKHPEVRVSKKYKDEFPHNKGIRARLEAIIMGGSACRNVLKHMQQFAIPAITNDGLRETLQKQVEEALAAGDLALQAVSGWED